MCANGVGPPAVRAFKAALRTNRRRREAAFRNNGAALPPWWNAAVLAGAAAGHATLDAGVAKPFWFSPLGRAAHAAHRRGQYPAFCAERAAPERWLAAV